MCIRDSPKATEIARLNLDAATAGLTYAEEQIGLQVAEGYYNLLFRQELIHVADEQLKLTRETLTKTAALVRAGKWSRDKLAEVEAQLAKDSVNYLRACSDTEPVSYTHLDVYKRQGLDGWPSYSVLWFA